MMISVHFIYERRMYKIVTSDHIFTPEQPHSKKRHLPVTVHTGGGGNAEFGSEMYSILATAC